MINKQSKSLMTTKNAEEEVGGINKERKRENKRKRRKKNSAIRGNFINFY